MSYEMPILNSGLSSDQRIWEVVEDARHEFGTRGQTEDGRSFYYAAFRGGTALIAGKLLSNAPVSGDFDDLAIGTLTIGTSSASITPASTQTYASSELVGGFMQTNSGSTGQGRQYRITGNPATSANTAFTLEFERIREENFSADTTVTIVPNPYSSVTFSADINSLCVGVTLSDVPIGSTNVQYFWVQTWGVACVQAAASNDVIGHTLLLDTNDGTYIGQIDLNGGGGSVDQLQQIGTNMFTSTSGDHMPVFLQIAP